MPRVALRQAGATMACAAVGQFCGKIVRLTIYAVIVAWALGLRGVAHGQTSHEASTATAAPSMVGLLRLFSPWSRSTDADADHAPAAEPGSWHQKTSIDVEPSAESWAGVDAYRRVVSLYGGVTWSPLGNLRQDGPRLRIVGGQSFYGYGGRRYDDSLEQSTWVSFSGRATFVEALAGWQVSSGPTTLKLFGGVTGSSHQITPYDEATQVQGARKGAKAALEVWHNWAPNLWTSLDLTAARVHRMYSAQLRTGWRVNPSWSLGPEASLTGHSEAALQRLGVFVRYESLGDEFTISGGHMRARGDIPSAYGTAQYLRRF
jgi:Cellulose biosynthesis protein BcsS